MELVIQVVIEVVVTGGDRGCDCVRDYVSAKESDSNRPMKPKNRSDRGAASHRG